MLALTDGIRYEFIFTNLVPGNTRHFTSVMGVHKAYMSSKLYRELKLRGAVVHNKQLKILPLEQVITTVHGVWNLSSDQGSLGTFIVTNIRMIWFADTNESFNISLPYLQIESVKIRDSKFGTALVVSSSLMSGGYVLGFRVDPEEKLKTLYKELTSLHEIYSNNPIYGVEYSWYGDVKHESQEAIVEYLDVVEEPRGEISNVLASYLVDGQEKDGPPVYAPELGLAIERLRDGYTLQKLWEVIPQ